MGRDELEYKPLLGPLQPAPMAYSKHIHKVQDLNQRISNWQERADRHKENQLVNPFSYWEGASHRPVLDKTDPNYGKPIEGSMTEKRGQKATQHVAAEIAELCHVISELGEPQPDGSFTITFGHLFHAYTRISDKVVGMLIRARKRGLVHFEGEMLYQRQDDDVVITCMKVPPQLPREKGYI